MNYWQNVILATLKFDLKCSTFFKPGPGEDRVWGGGGGGGKRVASVYNSKTAF